MILQNKKRLLGIVFVLLFCLLALFLGSYNAYSKHAKIICAVGDIKGMELALTKLMTDANVSTLFKLFNPDGVADYLADDIVQGGLAPVRVTGVLTTEQFQRAQELYTNTITALIRHGRNALKERDKILDIEYSQVLRKEIAGLLGTSYLENVGPDPWGNPYQIFPGPWPRNMSLDDNALEANGNLIIFRLYNPHPLKEMPFYLTGKHHFTDTLTINYDPSSPNTPPHEVEFSGDISYPSYGFPAPRDRFVYIYSFGPNLISGQAIYSNSGYSWDSYDKRQSPQHWGGGDDISNWDSSYESMRMMEND